MQGINIRNLLTWVIAALVLISFMQVLEGQHQQLPACFGKDGAALTAIAAKQQTQYCTIDESQLKTIVTKHDQAVDALTFKGSVVFTKLTNGWTGYTVIGGDTDSTAIKALADNANPKVAYKTVPEDQPSLLGGLLFSFAPMLLLIGFYYYMLRGRMGGGGGAGMFGMFKGKHKLVKPSGSDRVTFEDVAGIDEAKADLEEVVDYLKNPGKYTRLGGRVPRGILLVGPPGTGKTLLARAVAGEANVPFFSISGSDFVEMFVGVGASRVRSLFEDAKKNAPCIIFIDELDAVGRHRGTGLGGGHDEKEQTLNQMLVELSGIGAIEGVILIGATNRPDVLDPALLRSGRFDKQVVVPNPDVVGREAIIKVHIRRNNVPIAADVDPKAIAQMTMGFSGADLENLVNQAALAAAKKGKSRVDMSDFSGAKDTMLLGAERRSLNMSPEEQELTAYHEAGHAICSLNVEYGDPVTKVTRVPRGRALGVTLMEPERDRLSQSLGLCEDRLTVAMGGRAAEVLLYKDKPKRVTSGASGDIDAATKIATAMVTEWGFSDALGPVKYSANEGNPFLGMQLTQSSTLSEKFRVLIDNEKKRFIVEGLDRARAILDEHWDEVDALAKELLKRETLSGAEVKALLADVRSKKAAAMHPAAAPESAGSAEADAAAAAEHTPPAAADADATERGADREVPEGEVPPAGDAPTA